MIDRAMIAAVVLLVAGCGSDSDTNGTGGVAGGTGTGGGGATGTGGSPATGGSPGTGGATGTGGAAGSAGGSCEPSCTNEGFSCCGSTCVNHMNDILNSGTCGELCTSDHPYCDQGTCGAAPCAGGLSCETNEFCCGMECCSERQLCCAVPGPVAQQFPRCTDPTSEGTCPRGCLTCVCASPDTPIATPSGDIAISDLRVGDLVYSVDHCEVRAVPIGETNHTLVRNHEVMRLKLANGEELRISAGHPTADGRMVGGLRTGDEIGGVAILDVARVAYEHEHTYDILAESDTGAYFAGGALMGSTLAPPGTRVSCW